VADDHVATVTLNRPDAYNAVTEQTAAEFDEPVHVPRK